MNAEEKSKLLFDEATIKTLAQAEKKRQSKQQKQRIMVNTYEQHTDHSILLKKLVRKNPGLILGFIAGNLFGIITGDLIAYILLAAMITWLGFKFDQKRNEETTK